MDLPRMFGCPVGFTLGIALILVGAFPGKMAAKSPEFPESPDLAPLVEKVRALVVKYYPKAVVKLAEEKIHISFNTRKFMVHHPLLDGSFQDAVEMMGPQKGGILAELELRPGMYGGMAAVPQTFNYHYFKLELLAPYSRKLDSHLYVHLYFPQDATKEFVREFCELMNGFDKELVPVKK